MWGAAGEMSLDVRRDIGCSTPGPHIPRGVQWVYIARRTFILHPIHPVIIMEMSPQSGHIHCETEANWERWWLCAVSINLGPGSQFSVSDIHNSRFPLFVSTSSGSGWHSSAFLRIRLPWHWHRVPSGDADASSLHSDHDRDYREDLSKLLGQIEEIYWAVFCFIGALIVKSMLSSCKSEAGSV